MTTTPAWLRHLVAGALVLAAPTLADAQTYASAQAFVYPARGQTSKQQELDHAHCSRWAVQQSSFDPADGGMAAVAPPPSEQVTGSGARLRGAAGGAALGAVGGAIGGDAGKGAAIGAGVGAVFGGLRRRHEIERDQQAYENQVVRQQHAMAQGQANYERAFAACMTSRGYSVR